MRSARRGRPRPPTGARRHDARMPHRRRTASAMLLAWPVEGRYCSMSFRWRKATCLIVGFCTITQLLVSPRQPATCPCRTHPKRYAVLERAAMRPASSCVAGL